MIDCQCANARDELRRIANGVSSVRRQGDLDGFSLETAVWFWREGGESRILKGMKRDSSSPWAHRPGEQSVVVAERLEGVDLDCFFGPVRLLVPLYPARRVRAQIAKRTVGHEGVEQSGRLEEVDEERQLPKRRHRRLLVPLDPDRPEKTVQVDPFQPLRHNHRLLTRPVSPRRRRVALHALENARFSPSRQNQTAVSRITCPAISRTRSSVWASKLRRPSCANPRAMASPSASSEP